jgi:hypothetical protein
MTHRVTPLLICATLVWAGAAHAQAHGPDARQLRDKGRQIAEREATEPEMRAARLVEMNAWLGRLAGRYSLAGEARTLEYVSHDCIEGGICYARRPAAGKVDCAAIAGGPGLHCAVNGQWPRFFRALTIPGTPDEITWRGPFLDIAMMLFGVDPDRLAIRLLLVDGQSKATEALGFVKDGAVAFRVLCAPDPDASNCPVLRIREFPGRRQIEMEYADHAGGAGSSVPPWLAFRFVLRPEQEDPAALE